MEIIGDVAIGNSCYIGSGAIIRGDYGSIKICNNTSVQENCVIHAKVGAKCTIGNNVTISHGAMVHGPTIHNNVIIGMGAIIADDVVVNEWFLIGASALVPDGKFLEEESLVVGVPAKIFRKISDKNKMLIEYSANVYSELASRSLTGLKEL